MIVCPRDANSTARTLPSPLLTPVINISLSVKEPFSLFIIVPNIVFWFCLCLCLLWFGNAENEFESGIADANAISTVLLSIVVGGKIYIQ